jgi:hypothetical protein
VAEREAGRERPPPPSSSLTTIPTASTIAARPFHVGHCDQIDDDVTVVVVPPPVGAIGTNDAISVIGCVTRTVNWDVSLEHAAPAEHVHATKLYPSFAVAFSRIDPPDVTQPDAVCGVPPDVVEIATQKLVV